ncbi:SMC-Scp complex subunit ScpB [Microbulbifer sp. 2201CG32-9]|uniref:SMC-Scp complex subunit ScpB n=1 Tax=unclassified Microbulbifer TaxID=2619833 RepID=UPI00345B57C6
MTIAPELLRRVVEGALLASGQSLSEDKLLSLIEEGERPEKAQLQATLREIADSCAERGFELRQVASGWRFQVPQDLAPWVNRLWEEKPQKYSRAVLETLAIIAYRQPITRGDIEEIRGVAVSSHIVKTLAERGWIKVVGHRDVPGKPALYATTREFLDHFNLRTLDDLPTLAEIRDIDSLNQALDLSGAPGSADDSGALAPVALAQGEDTPESADENPPPVDDGQSLADDAGVAEVEAAAEPEAERHSPQDEPVPNGSDTGGGTIFPAIAPEFEPLAVAPAESGMVVEPSLSVLPASSLFDSGGDHVDQAEALPPAEQELRETEETE